MQTFTKDACSKVHLFWLETPEKCICKPVAGATALLTAELQAVPTSATAMASDLPC